MIFTARGFSLLEVVSALAMSAGVGVVVFHLFHQNERLFRDQNLMIEMQQSARVVASQIADEIRMSGEGMPIYASTFDNVETEPVAAILSGSSHDRIVFRTGLSDTESYITNAMPLHLFLDSPVTLGVRDAGIFSDTLGTASPSGRFVYISGPAFHGAWSWTRAELTKITPTTLTVVPRQAGDAGLRFTRTPAVTLEEVVSFYISGGFIKRAMAADMTDQTNPAWSSAQDIGRDFTSLVFTYYDKDNRVVMPNSLSNRLSIARVDVRVTAQTAGLLTNGTRGTYPLALRSIPRNARIR
jgi:hypothetical protein